MALNRFMVDDHGKFGRLIKAWGRGLEPIPRNKAEFEAAMTKYGITPSWPTGENAIKTVVVEQVPLGTLHLLVAPAKLYNESEAYYRQPGAVYPLPPYYQEVAFQGRTPVIGDLVLFNDMRTGDYTISHCS